MKKILLFLAVNFAFAIVNADKLKDRALTLLNSPTNEIVFCTRPLANCHLMYATFGNYADEYNAEIYPKGGSTIKALNLKTGKVRTILEDKTGSFRDIRVSYDGRKILFAWRKKNSVYHLYEMNADGSNIVQLTDGEHDDFDATYLPDGSFVFSSARCRRFTPCNRVRTAIIYKMQADRKTIYPLSSNVLLEDRPTVLPDGRILYTRWDYVDRATENFRDLWTMNPDGTGQMIAFGGHPIPYPKFFAECDAMPIPNSDKIVCVFSPAFGYRENAGKVMIINLKDGQFGGSEKMISPKYIEDKLGWSIGNGGKRCLIGLRDPYPLAENCHFVAQNKSIFVLDNNGNMEKIYEDSEVVHDPRALRPCPKEPVIASKIDITKTTGQFIVTDVYQSRNMKGIERGTIKKLLIMEDLPKNASRHGWRGEHGGHISLHRILGEVPVEPDGSAYFEVPALRAVFFVALDKNGKAVKRMQNFTQVMPNEIQSCVGCHENRSTSSIIAKGKSTMAVRRAPSIPKKIDGVPEVYRFLRDIQPILDKHCLKCHNHDNPTAKVILSDEWTEWRTVSYDRLYEFKQISRATPWREFGNRGSYEFGTGASPLMQKIDGSHNGVKLSQKEYDILRCWIESSAHYTGTYATHNNFENQVGAKFAIHKGVNIGDGNKKTAFNSFRKPQLAEPMESVAKRRCYSCHENMYKLGRLRFEQENNTWEKSVPPDFMNNPNYSLTLFNLTNPDNSLFLRAPLAKEDRGYNWCKDKQGNEVSVFESKEDPDYKLVRAEIEKTIERQNKYKRIEMPDYQPKQYYIHWMKFFGILPKNHNDNSKVNFYDLDEQYWRSLWWIPNTIQYDNAVKNISQQ
ncbi:MAG: hypothetical protein J6B07_00480 [Opitutales bacterium]|nr:hypothetical protein [Opitutales bacterium]